MSDHRLPGPVRASRLPLRLLALSLLCGGIIAGCGSKLADVSDNELADQMHACRTDQDPSPGRAIACDNYQRECTRRRKEGKFVC